MKRKILALLISLVALWSCDEEMKFDESGDRYFPLQVGNYWKLVPENPLGDSIKITVTAEVVIHGKNYFKLHQVFKSYYDPTIERDIYLRTNGTGYIYTLVDSVAGTEQNALRLGAPNGYKWLLRGNTYVHVKKTSELINGHTLSDCKMFSYDDPSVVDEENSATFASDIGYCRIYGGWGRFSQLAVARINGVEHYFND